MTTTLATACDALAAALSYPGAGFRDTVRETVDATMSLSGDAEAHGRRFAAAVLGMSIVALQDLYTQTFDLDPRCTLDTGWHVFGDAYNRGAFLACLRDDLRVAGVAETTELPDHLPQVLRLIGRLPRARAEEFGAFATLAIDGILDALAGRGNAYEHLLRAAAAAIRVPHRRDEERPSGDRS